MDTILKYLLLEFSKFYQISNLRNKNTKNVPPICSVYGVAMDITTFCLHQYKLIRIKNMREGCGGGEKRRGRRRQEEEEEEEDEQEEQELKEEKKEEKKGEEEEEDKGEGGRCG